ncbi:MAG: polysaccharide biosynthesis/export family protein [Victivallaceae bacterium]|nr:polysaccharide biosynthesis/export family protein [Victivallaceae bacterium]
MKYNYLFFLSALLLLTGCAPDHFGPVNVPEEYSTDQVMKTSKDEVDAELKELQKLPEANYTISSEDHFHIVVYGYPDVSATNIVITPDGFLNMPLIGPVKVGGLTVKEANLKVAEELSYYVKSTKVALIPVQVTGFSFVIAGQVLRPGKYPIAIGRTRLIDAIALAQGFTSGLYQGTTFSLADLDNAYIAREGKILPVSFNKALLQGDNLHNIPLQNGDYIYVPQVMGSTVTVLGEVHRQNYVGYHEGLTLVNALSFCMGLMETHADNVKIIRGGMKDPVVYTVNITKMLEGKIKDFPLQPNDIVFVPRDGLSDWNVMVRKILPTIQAMSMLAGPFGNPSSLYYSN